MILVTGGAGFIGSRTVHALNRRGERDVVVVDDLTDGRKFRNLLQCELRDYWDLPELYEGRLHAPPGRWPGGRYPELVVHQGACAVTTEWDGRLMMQRNYAASRALLEFCLERRIPMVYASSAAVYGLGTRFREDPANERPANVYGYSKLLFDQLVRRLVSERHAPVVGLRYFNVYGPGELHKGSMASMVLQLALQARREGVVRLFGATPGYGPGEQRRDFVHVDDVVEVALWAGTNAAGSGIYNVGTGRARSFNELAASVLSSCGPARVEYIDLPPSLRGRYQSYTEADLGALRAAGCPVAFRSIEEGVPRYLAQVAGELSEGSGPESGHGAGAA